MRICFIIEYYPPHVGGGETLFSALAQGFVKRGHACEVVTARLKGTPGFEVDKGVAIHRVRVPSFGDRHWFTLLALPRAFKAVKRADIVHTMTYNGALPAWLAARCMKKPAVLLAHEVLGRQWHGLGLSKPGAALFQALEKGVMALPFEAYPANSRATARALKRAGIAGKTIHTAYPGVDPVFFQARDTGKEEAVRKKLGVSPGGFMALYFGRPGVVKGVEYLVEAVPEMEKNIPGFSLVLILSRKPRPGRRAVLKKIQALSNSSIRVVDPVDRKELPHFVRAADCVVVPSLNEGFGFTCVEACSQGTPVVATRAGSLPEVVSGKHVLVRPADPMALARGVIRVFKKEYKTLPVKEFGWETYVEAHEKLYKELIKAHA